MIKFQRPVQLSHLWETTSPSKVDTGEPLSPAEIALFAMLDELPLDEQGEMLIELTRIAENEMLPKADLSTYGGYEDLEHVKAELLARMEQAKNRQGQ